MRQVSKPFLALFSLLCLALLAACGGSEASDEADGAALSVVATTTLVGDVVEQIGGEAVDLTVLLPRGVDPHSFEPSAQDALVISEADLVFINGLDLEEFMQPLLENSDGDALVVAVSDGLTPLEFEREQEEGEEHEEGEDDDHDGADPHVWFDPANVIIWTENIAAALSAADAANAEAYQANAAEYISQLEALDAWAHQQVETLDPEQRVLVTDHDSFGYFAHAYGFEIVGTIIPGFSTQSSPSAGELAGLQSEIEAQGVAAIFVGSTVNPQMAEQMGADLGVDVVPLYTGSLSDGDGPAGSYLDFMRYNVGAIVEALGGAR